MSTKLTDISKYYLEEVLKNGRIKIFGSFEL